MLVTHCPECKTAFRVTEAILDQAGGQVRCGRCSHVFNGIEDLSERPDAATRRIEPFLAPVTTAAPEPDPAPEYDGSSTNWFLTDAPPDKPEQEPASAQPPVVRLEPESRFDSEKIPEPDGEAESEDEPELEAVTSADADFGANGRIEPDFEIESELATELAPETETADTSPEDEPADPDWLPPLDEEPRRRWQWVAAAVLLALSLSAQLVHAYRADLANVAGIGRPLQGLYARLGHEIAPSVDLAAYELVDLAFTTETAADGLPGWLIIEARLRNKGPEVQPFPQVFVALKDRWRRTVAGRYFEPEEYAVTPYASYARMPVGVVMDAQLIIADPGPEVTEYELQLCTRSGQGFLCDGDTIFE